MGAHELCVRWTRCLRFPLVLNTHCFTCSELPVLGDSEATPTIRHNSNAWAKNLQVQLSTFQRTNYCSLQTWQSALTSSSIKFSMLGVLCSSHRSLRNTPLCKGMLRAELIDKAQEAAFKEIPEILEAIRVEAKTIINA